MRKKAVKDQNTLPETAEITQEVDNTATDNILSVVDDVNVGTMLKKARLKKKKDLRKIADVLCIRECYLQALEDSDYENFPGRTYAVGFLRNYADFLGLDVDVLIEQYRKETSFIKPEEREMPIIERPNLFPKAKYLFWAVLVIVLMWSFWYFLTYSETPEAVVLPKEEVIAQAPVEVIPKIVEVENVVLDEQKQPTPPTLQPEVKKEVKVPVKEKNAIQIVANQEVWVEIEQDDMLILSRTLKKGEVYDVPTSDTEMFLKTGNAGGMDILVDGKKVKPFGPVGAVRSGISLLPEKLKKH